ncbi:ribonuclease III [Helicobacter sp. CLO-3]|nr:ribonuclease III [Helicobacter sp. CLO-3]
MNFSDFSALESRLGYRFANHSLLVEALTHRSCIKPYNNERLEFLGDAVLDLLVGEYLFERFPKYDEGKLSKMRSSLVNEKSFADFARDVGIGEMLRLSSSEEHNHGRQKDSLLSNAFEAVIGAIYRESGLERAREIVYRILAEHYPNMQMQDLTIDYKTALQEITQERFAKLPIYELLSQSGPDHQKQFTMQISINGEVYAVGQGNSKKSAQQACAKIAYEKLKAPSVQKAQKSENPQNENVARENLKGENLKAQNAKLAKVDSATKNTARENLRGKNITRENLKKENLKNGNLKNENLKNENPADKPNTPKRAPKMHRIDSGDFTQKQKSMPQKPREVQKSTSQKPAPSASHEPNASKTPRPQRAPYKPARQKPSTPKTPNTRTQTTPHKKGDR